MKKHQYAHMTVANMMENHLRLEVEHYRKECIKDGLVPKGELDERQQRQ